MSGAVLPRSNPTATLALTVNGRPVTALVEPRLHLADLLREELDFTGTHLGCEHGVCGACTVLVDGEPARACLTYAAGCDGAAVTTIEGLDGDEVAIELRAAFSREHALQCGYCTPGMLVSARDLVLRLPEADERRVRLGLSGNLCRCTGYVGAVRAVVSVIRDRRGRGIPAAIGPRELGPVGARPGPAGPARSTPIPPVAPTMAAAGKLAADLRVDFQPANRIEQSFAVPFPPDQVYAMLGRVEEVATCLPGASVTGQPAPDRVEGAIRVRLGPITAVFNGTARIERNEVAQSGRIVGTGQDNGGRSTALGLIEYRVLSEAARSGTLVELSVGYTLKGPLAQFGRPGLVRDLAGRITAAFADNLSALLAGHSVSQASQRLSLLPLMSSVLRGWTRSLIACVRWR